MNIIFEKIKSLNLRLSSDQDIQNLLTKIELPPLFIRTFQKGEIIVRTRPNERKLIFNEKSDLIYPPKLSSSYGRANIQDTISFYGCLIGNDYYSLIRNQKDLIDAIVPSISEQYFFKVAPELRVYKVTYGVWQVLKEFSVAVIVQNKDYIGRNDYIDLMIRDFEVYLDTLEKNQKEHAYLINEFISNEFSKEVTVGEEYNYKISSNFTEIIYNKGLFGLIYPSTKMEGRGVNIVLKPTIVDNCLDLVRAGECTILKTSKGINVSHDCVTKIIEKNNTFKYEIHSGNKPKIACMFQAGIKESVKFLIQKEFKNEKTILGYDKFSKMEKLMIDFGYLIKLAIEISDLTRDKTADENNIIASNIFSKTTMSALSIWCLVEEYADNVFKRKVYDLPSAFILLRSIFEAYKVFNHLLISSDDEDETELRKLLFKRHSKYEERDLCSFINGKDTYYNELSQCIADFTDQIEKNKAFLKRNPDEQKSLLDTHCWCEKKYKPVNTDLLATEAGINPDQNKMTIKFLSNYAHCMSFALEQMDFSYKSKDIQGLIKLLEEQTSIYLALTIDSFSKLNEKVSELISKEGHFISLLTNYKELISADLKSIQIKENKK